VGFPTYYSRQLSHLKFKRSGKLTLGVPRPTNLILIVDGRWSLRDILDRVAVAAPINNTQGSKSAHGWKTSILLT
jgi:hypothetical protein